MKLAFTADLHVSPQKLKESERNLTELFRVLDDEQIDILMLGGDIFEDFNICGRDENFGTVFYTILSPLKDFLAQDQRRRVLMIPGNHDMSTRKDQKDALYGFEYQDRIIVSHGISSYYIAKGLVVITLPWMYPSMYESKELLLKEIKDAFPHKQGCKKILLGHCEIEGCEAQSGYSIIGGHFSFTPTEINDLGFDEVFLGHYHKKQLWYVGTPWQHNFGEEGYKGSIEVLEITEGG